MIWLGVNDTNDNDNANIEGVSWLESSFYNQVGPKLASLGLALCWAKNLVELPSYTSDPIRYEDDPRLEEIFKHAINELRKNGETIMMFHNSYVKRKIEQKIEAEEKTRQEAEHENKRNADLTAAQQELERMQLQAEETPQSARKNTLRNKKGEKSKK